MPNLTIQVLDESLISLPLFETPVSTDCFLWCFWQSLTQSNRIPYRNGFVNAFYAEQGATVDQCIALMHSFELISSSGYLKFPILYEQPRTIAIAPVFKPGNAMVDETIYFAYDVFVFS